MDKQNEYCSLREEILRSKQEIRNYRSLLYTIVAAVLVFAVDNGEAILFLVPFVAIIPLYLAEMDEIDSMLCVGAYMYVFIEPNTECGWEHRLHRYDELCRNEYSVKKVSINSYALLSICCIGLSLWKLDIYHFGFETCLVIILQAVISIYSIAIFINKRPDYYERKKQYIKKWEKIKEETRSLE